MYAIRSYYALAVTALLSGQGAQSAGMLKSLYQSIPEIKALMDQGEAIFQKRRGASLLEIVITSYSIHYTKLYDLV